MKVCKKKEQQFVSRRKKFLGFQDKFRLLKSHLQQIHQKYLQLTLDFYRLKLINEILANNLFLKNLRKSNNIKFIGGRTSKLYVVRPVIAKRLCTSVMVLKHPLHSR